MPSPSQCSIGPKDWENDEKKKFGSVVSVKFFFLPNLKVTFLLKFPKFITNARIHRFFLKIFTIVFEDIGKHLKKN